MVHLVSRCGCKHVDFDMSDHLTILLYCCPTVNGKGRRRQRFLFDNMWASDPSCTDVINTAWASTSSNNVVENLLFRIDICAEELGKWKKEEFGHVGTEIRKLEQQPRGQHDAISRGEILRQIREWRKREEIMWWQRARSDYLSYGDANTRWFHSCANMRKAQNSIECLIDDNGVHCTDEDSVSHTITEYFAQSQ
ncbi:hypothetical protein Cgig2_007030 [Carnegiea gigantea]|uniref:Uncharacterized protein n=1 Tax=Carnegiea gigantea TaxID=171969 RepID=A0A9Q1QEL4_9CARY|nr:hypothetical protein Cgig2_007030 [Carnegiea gigantea]